MPLNVVPLSNHYSIAFRALVLVAISHRSYKHRSLTIGGIIAALITGIIHSLPPSNLYLTLLLTFYVTSSKATKFKEEIKAKKTAIPKSASTTSDSHSQRTHVQVLANSLVASLLILASVFVTNDEANALLKAGIIGQYVAVISDTWSSELGILSTCTPVLITTLKKVPPGTNGGITKAGLLSGLAGSALLSAIAAYTYQEKKLLHFVYFSLVGLVGTLIDSLLGALFQYSLINEKGLVLEPIGGVKIDQALLWKEKQLLRRVSGTDILSNNQVNLLMAFLTTLLSVGFYSLFF